MSGNSVVLDTNVIISASKWKVNLEDLFNQYDNFFVSVITFMEVYRFDFQDEREKKLIDDFFSSIEIIDVNLSIAENVINFQKNSTKKIKLPDAIILATAKYANADLLSDDWDDFVGIDSGIKIIKLVKYKL